MKNKYRIIVIIYLVFIFSKTNAQNTTFNNVAIGIDYPTYGAKIKTNFPAYTGGWGRAYFITNETGDQSFFTFGSSGYSNNGVSSVTSSFIGKDLDTRYMTFLPNGNIGIATNNPQTTFQIGEFNSNGASKISIPGVYNFEQMRLGQYGNGAAGLEMITHTGQVDSFGVRLFASTDTGSNSLLIQTANPASSTQDLNYTTRLAVNINGNVGIGTANPTGKFEVSGRSAVYSDFASYSGTTINNILPNGKEPTFIVSENPSGNLQYAVGGQVTYRGGLSFGRGGPGIYSINPNPAGSGYYGELRFHTTYWNGSDYSNTDRMVIKLDGNVGIGTTNPTSKLTVAGNINSREVKVTVDAGADFVFEKDYALPSLQDVEKFVTENKHLPEIASAKEMQANGINLSEMNIKLLQKIEEMTLYMIDFKKEIDALKVENRIQKEEINILKTTKK
jgi:hypothetical protein